MPGVDYSDLPFYSRPDLSPYLFHFTKSSDGLSAFKVLVKILKDGYLQGSTTEKGFIRGSSPATCFMDVPFMALKHVFTPENCNPQNPRYEPYGIYLGKPWAYDAGLRPVLYLSSSEIKKLDIVNDEQWRIVRFEVDEDDKWVSWLHEREWRKKGNLELPSNPGVVVRTQRESRILQRFISENPKKFKIKPRAVIPLSVVCQGLLF